ncbi:MAG: phosphodiester glycosidase family protein [Oscillospiraceae bacterium]|jgi:exopolysaccharide biosynthesis protein|nr:phosphodiester glycosidase family protein [Oscillospiraceae bacterium]
MVKLLNVLFVVLTVVLIVLILYLAVVFLPIPWVSDMRDLWIETAMTTGEHQWLATMLFPQYLINEVMSKQVNPSGILSDPDLVDIDNNDDKPVFSGKEDQVTIDTVTKKMYDEFGNEIIVDDIEQELRIIQVKGNNFVGHLILVPDPSRIVVRNCEQPEVIGDFIKKLCGDDGIAAINANAFLDIEGHGNGGHILGYSVSDGAEWGDPEYGRDFYISMGFDKDNKLIVGNLTDFNQLGIRDLVQYQPAMIIDGKQLVSGSAAWGIHPRTAIGQRADGTVILAVIDGRQLGYSLGTTIGELADLLFEYGCVNAAACDGGSSSIMFYNGKFIGTPSTPMKETGRYLPNAIVVLKK